MTRARPVELITAVLAAHLASACEQPASQPDDIGVVRWDSAGIEIVENHAPERSPGGFWSIDSEPEIVIGGQQDPSAAVGDSSHLVWQVYGLARLDDGRVAVLSTGNRHLAIFTSSGQLVRTIGRRGQGPGEFTPP